MRWPFAAKTRGAMDLTGKRTVIDLAGHVSRQMLQRYSHIRAKSKVDAVNALNKGSSAPVPSFFAMSGTVSFLPASAPVPSSALRPTAPRKPCAAAAAKSSPLQPADSEREHDAINLRK